MQLTDIIAILISLSPVQLVQRAFSEIADGNRPDADRPAVIAVPATAAAL